MSRSCEFSPRKMDFIVVGISFCAGVNLFAIFRNFATSLTFIMRMKFSDGSFKCLLQILASSLFLQIFRHTQQDSV